LEFGNTTIDRVLAFFSGNHAYHSLQWMYFQIHS